MRFRRNLSPFIKNNFVDNGHGNYDEIVMTEKILGKIIATISLLLIIMKVMDMIITAMMMKS